MKTVVKERRDVSMYFDSNEIFVKEQVSYCPRITYIEWKKFRNNSSEEYWKSRREEDDAISKVLDEKNQSHVKYFADKFGVCQEAVEKTISTFEYIGEGRTLSEFRSIVVATDLLFSLIENDMIIKISMGFVYAFNADHLLVKVKDYLGMFVYKYKNPTLADNFAEKMGLDRMKVRQIASRAKEGITLDEFIEKVEQCKNDKPSKRILTEKEQLDKELFGNCYFEFVKDPDFEDTRVHTIKTNVLIPKNVSFENVSWCETELLERIKRKLRKCPELKEYGIKLKDLDGKIYYFENPKSLDVFLSVKE